MLGFEHPLYKAMEKRITQYAEYEEVKRDYPELTGEKDIRFEAIGKVLRNNLKELVEKKSKDSALQVWWDSLMRFLGKFVAGIYKEPFKLAALDILNANIKDYGTELIQANSRLTELDDVYLSKTGKYKYYNKKTVKTKAKTTLNQYQIKAINQKELDKVSIDSDISLNTSTIDEIKEMLRGSMKEFEYIDAGGLNFLAEQVRSGRWKLSCQL
jgi:tRNA(Ile)-lysidine synthase TilS/MesJ